MWLSYHTRGDLSEEAWGDRTAGKETREGRIYAVRKSFVSMRYSFSQNSRIGVELGISKLLCLCIQLHKMYGHFSNDNLNVL